MKLLRFLFTGSCAAATEFLVFYVIISVGLFGVSLIVANAISFMSGFGVSFVLNRQWVFKSDADTRRQLVLYFIVAIVNLYLSNLLIVLLVDTGIDTFIAKIIIMAMIASWNYLLFSKVIFKNTDKLSM